MKPRVVIQTEDFNVSQVLDQLRAGDLRVGAICSFVGTVRDTRLLSGNAADQIVSMALEHYPGMTEKALAAIAAQAQSRWDIVDTLIIHRVGSLQPLDQIVLVVVSGAHRGEAFKACEFIMDALKTEAPFWKKEVTASGERWLDAKDSDDVARERWIKPAHQ